MNFIPSISPRLTVDCIDAWQLARSRSPSAIAKLLVTEMCGVYSAVHLDAAAGLETVANQSDGKELRRIDSNSSG